METANIIIGLHPTEDDLPRNESISIGFMVDDINEVKELFSKLGIKSSFEDGKSGIYMHFKNPDGTTLYFTQPKWR